MKLSRNVTLLLAAAALVVGTAGCVAAPTEHTAADPSATAPATPAATDATDAPHPAFVDPVKGAPVVQRKGAPPVAKRAVAKKTSFADPATWSDGVTVKASGFSRGTVSGTGAGIIKSDYVVFTLTIDNHSSKKLDLTSVVVTMLAGAKLQAVAPVYDSVKVHDFDSDVAPGKTATARYAFALPKKTASAVLYVDTDGSRLAAELTGAIPQ
jgi:hypothetical protein